MVVEGCIQHAADELRFVANLIDAELEASVHSPVVVDTVTDFTLRAHRAVAESEAFHAFKRGQHQWVTSCYSGGWRSAHGLCSGEFGTEDKGLALLAELNELAKDTYVHPQCYTFVYAGLGRQEQMEFQERAYEHGASPLNYLTPFVRELYNLDRSPRWTPKSGH